MSEKRGVLLLTLIMGHPLDAEVRVRSLGPAAHEEDPARGDLVERDRGCDKREGEQFEVE